MSNNDTISFRPTPEELAFLAQASIGIDGKPVRGGRTHLIRHGIELVRREWEKRNKRKQP